MVSGAMRGQDTKSHRPFQDVGFHSEHEWKTLQIFLFNFFIVLRYM